MKPSYSLPPPQPPPPAPCQGRSVLVVSHTHSAVDTILERLLAAGQPFVRVGGGHRSGSTGNGGKEGEEAEDGPLAEHR